MKRRIKRIAPLQTGKMLGVLYGCMGLLFLPFFVLVGAATALTHHPQQAQDGSGPPAVFIALMTFGFGILMPIIYGVMGFLFGIITAVIYNLIAGWIGGIEVEVE
jgi:hypothetical protein